ncbi:c-type cytochrome [Caballeronia cordobensis]|uniref:Cytochrome c, class I n=1 Tax=Caballeronia cordobensis TaxID=1353886 RepID=A0A158JLT1_CABCO|nr:cytochrome c [Caballeronia cordobensis]BAO88748.1 class I cytochrome c [Burkholderia sp. RPE67]SAL69824.1 cytochrome c, class I [Caballeronia cordobensis]
MKPRAVIAAAMLAALGSAAASQAQAQDAARARQDWVLNCMGCHTADGSGIPGKVPPLRESLGHFVSLPEGRTFVMRVPGAANSALNDADLANVLNWLLTTMNEQSRPASFRPYTAEEIAAHRRPALTDVARTRTKLVKELQENGVNAVPEHY